MPSGLTSVPLGGTAILASAEILESSVTIAGSRSYVVTGEQESFWKLRRDLPISPPDARKWRSKLAPQHIFVMRMARPSCLSQSANSLQNSSQRRKCGHRSNDVSGKDGLRQDLAPGALRMSSAASFLGCQTGSRTDVAA